MTTALGSCHEVITVTVWLGFCCSSGLDVDGLRIRPLEFVLLVGWL